MILRASGCLGARLVLFTYSNYVVSRKNVNGDRMKVLTNLMFRPAAAALALIMALPAWATELVMVEQPGCTYCARWDAEIAPAYPKTAEGRFAPLRREQLRALPDDVQPARRVMFTPTFLIVEEGREIARQQQLAACDQGCGDAQLYQQARPGQVGKMARTRNRAR